MSESIISDPVFVIRYLWILPLAASAILLVFVPGRHWLPSITLLSPPIEGLGLVKLRFPTGLVAIICLGFLAMARPVQIFEYEATPSPPESDIEFVVALDLSRSMLATEATFSIAGQEPTRLQAAKKEVRRFLLNRAGEPVGLIGFAGSPIVFSPLTIDYSFLTENLSQMRIGVTKDGTAIGSAIASAASLFDGNMKTRKVIIIITDGDNNSGKLSPIKAAELSQILAIKIYTVLLGTPGPHVIPTPSGPQRLPGQVDFEALQQASRITGAKAYRATSGDGLAAVFREIENSEKMTPPATEVIVGSKELFPWAVGLMIFLTCFTWAGSKVRFLCQRS